MKRSEKLDHALRLIAPLERAIQKSMPRRFGAGIKLPKRYEELTRERDILMDRFASDPDLRVHMRMWMLDFEGTAEPEWAKKRKHAIKKGKPVPKLTPKTFGDMVFANVDELSRKVREWLAEVGANVTDSGSGSGGWHLGCHCNDEELDALVRAARKRFVKELASGALTLSLHHWGWRFPDALLRRAKPRTTRPSTTVH
jgi:hypothetical protein